MDEAASPPPPPAFVYDRPMSPALGVPVLRLEVCKLRARDESWDVAGEWVDRDEAVFSDGKRPAFDAMVSAMVNAKDSGRDVLCLVADWPRLSWDREVREAFQARIRLVGGYTATGVGESGQRGAAALAVAARRAL